MKKTRTGRDIRDERADTHRSIREHKKKRFPGSAGYLLIPLTGLVVAAGLFFVSKDIFFSDKPPHYKKIVVKTEVEMDVVPRDIEPGLNEKTTDPEAVPKNADIENEVSASPEKTAKANSGSEKHVSINKTGTNVSNPEHEVSRFQKSDLWGIQLAMSTSKKDSERLAEEVRKKGYNPRITRPGEHYRVRVNGGPDNETALKVEKMLRSEGYDTLIVHSPAAVEPGSGKIPTKVKAEFSRYQKNGTWGVQLGMFPDKAGAMRLVGDIKKKGFNPEITKPGKYYRVRVKAGVKRETAEKIEALLKKDGYETLLVRSSG